MREYIDVYVDGSCVGDYSDPSIQAGGFSVLILFPDHGVRYHGEVDGYIGRSDAMLVIGGIIHHNGDDSRIDSIKRFWDSEHPSSKLIVSKKEMTSFLSESIAIENGIRHACNIAEKISLKNLQNNGLTTESNIVIRIHTDQQPLIKKIEEANQKPIDSGRCRALLSQKKSIQSSRRIINLIKQKTSYRVEFHYAKSHEKNELNHNLADKQSRKVGRQIHKFLNTIQPTKKKAPMMAP